MTGREVQLAARPQGEPKDSDFRLVSTAHSTATSTPANTIAFTSQVEPNSSAKPVT